MAGRKIGVKSKTQSVVEPKKQRLQLAKQNRQDARSSAFGRGRNIGLALDVSSLSDVEEENTLGGGLDPIKPEALDNRPRQAQDKRKLQLEAWRKQRQEEKLNQCRTRPNQKPVFKAGVVHHPANPWSFSQASPPLKKKTQGSKVKSTFSIVVSPRAPATRGATTRNMAKAATTGPQLKAVPNSTRFKAPTGIKPVVLTVPVTPKGIAQRKKAVFHGVQSSNLKSDLPTAKPTLSKTPIQFKACASFPTAVTNPTPKLSLNSEDPVTDSLPTSQRTPPVYSPYVTIRRGKYSDRKSKIFTPSVVGVSSDEKPTGILPSKDEPVTGVIIASVPTETISTANDGGTELEKDAIYFRNLLDSEILRLSAIADQWEAIKSELPESISEDVVSHIDLATGQTRLLIRSKFEQFRKLTYDCEIGTCMPPVLPIDLQGFWDMIYIQVEGLDKQYVTLTDVKSNNWVERTNTTQQKKKKAAPNQAAKRAGPTNTARTGLRAVIEAARKKKMESEKIEARYSASAESFVNDPRIPDIKATPENSSKRMSLLKQVLSTGAARRAAHSSPILMKVSQATKTIGSPTAATSIRVSVNGSTPFKGILKDTVVSSSAQRPSQKSVNFGGSTRKSLLPDLDEPVIIVEEAIHMLPPPSVPQPSLSTKSVPAQRKPRQSILDRLNLRGMMRQIAVNENEQNNDATPVASTDSPSRKRKSITPLIGVENIDNKQRRSYRKTPRKPVEPAFESVDSPSMARKSKPITPLIEVENIDYKQRRSYRKTPRKPVEPAFESVDSPSMARKSKPITPLIEVENIDNKQRRSYRKTPRKPAEPANRISLFGGLEQLESMTPPPLCSTVTGNLISFDTTPVRRSTRLESRK